MMFISGDNFPFESLSDDVNCPSFPVPSQLKTREKRRDGERKEARMKAFCHNTHT